MGVVAAHINVLDAEGWSHRTYQVATRDGRETVTGMVKGRIAVREQCETFETQKGQPKEYRFWWIIEDSVSGRKISQMSDKEAAFEFAERAKDVEGWGSITFQNHTMPPEMVAALKAELNNFVRVVCS